MSLAARTRSMRRTRPGAELDLRPQRDRELAADRGERARPGRIDRQIDLGAQAARRIVDVLEQVGLLHRLAAPQVGVEPAHQPLELGQHDGDRRRVGRLGDAVGKIAVRRLDGEADQLPGRGEPAEHQHQRHEVDLALASGGGIEEADHRRDMLVGEIADLRRDLSGQHGEHVARLEDAWRGSARRRARAAFRSGWRACAAPCRRPRSRRAPSRSPGRPSPGTRWWPGRRRAAWRRSPRRPSHRRARGRGRSTPRSARPRRAPAGRGGPARAHRRRRTARGR